MRVIAGSAGSLPLCAPKGTDTRPTTDKTKETLFNVLNPYIEGCVFVDLFSGSGAIGIEALSRGAYRAYFVERGREPVSCIEKNLAFTGLSKGAVLIKRDVYAALDLIREDAVDIIFMDPPYRMGHERRVLEKLKDFSYVTDDTLIVAEASLETDFSYLEEMGYETYKIKRYRTNQHIFIRRRTKND